MNVPAASTSIPIFDHHRPELASGDYTIEVTQTVSAGTSGETGKVTRAFSVLGPRFSLSPHDVHAMFPPPGSLGDHAKVFPHIVLERSTLPWERSPCRAMAEGDAPPWLALLLIDQAEEPYVKIDGTQPDTNPLRVRTCTVGELKSGAGGGFASLPGETGDNDDDKLAFIDIDREFLRKIVPTLDELRLLAHVRKGRGGVGGSGNGDAGKELAVVIGNRLPKPESRSTVHLVSLEARYDGGGFDLSGAGDTVRLVTLKSWQFTCTDDKNQSFQGLLRNLKFGSLCLPLVQNRDADLYLRIGCVPLRHTRTDGTSAIAWYRGPFVTGEIDDPDAGSPVLPVRRAADLLRHNARLAIDDVSYAAAWELGRLLALQNTGVATAIYNWRRCCYQEACLAATREETAHLPCGIQRPKFAFPRAWFDQLARLKGVPFNYLVPDERMLPRESIRFFRVDALWVKCLVNGAFSVGAGTEKECDCCAKHGEMALHGLPLVLSGFLLRSDVVAGWTRLEIDGYGAPRDGSPPERLGRIEPVARLSKNVLLCLFEGVVQTVDIHVPPEIVHFERKDDAGWASNPHDSQDLSDMRRYLKRKRDKTEAIPTTSSELAQDLIAQVPEVRFVVKS